MKKRKASSVSKLKPRPSKPGLDRLKLSQTRVLAECVSEVENLTLSLWKIKSKLIELGSEINTSGS